MKPTPDKDLDRYGKLLAILSDEAAAPNERDMALKKMRQMEDVNPNIRLAFSKRQAEQRRTAPPPGPTPPNLSAFWSAVNARFGPQVGAATDRVVSATVEQFTAAGVAAVEDLIRNLEDTVMSAIELIHEMRTDSELNLGRVDWQTEITSTHHVVKALEIHAGYDDETTGVLDAENKEEGDIAQIAIQLPLGLLLRVAEDPVLSQALVLDMLAAVDDGGDDDSEEAEPEPVPASRGRREREPKRSRYA